MGFQVYIPAVLHCFFILCSIPAFHIWPTICYGWLSIYSLLFLCCWPAVTLVVLLFLAEQLSDQFWISRNYKGLLHSKEHWTYQRRLETVQLKTIIKSDNVRLLQGFLMRLGLILPGSDQVIFALFSQPQSVLEDLILGLLNKEFSR